METPVSDRDQSQHDCEAVDLSQPTPAATIDPHPGMFVEEKFVAETEVCPASATKLKLSSHNASNRQFWQVCGTTFVTIFLAELGDKTQISTLLMSAEFHNPTVVFIGAALALIATSLLGVLVGRWLSTRLSPKTLDTAAGITLALIAVWLFWDVLHPIV